MNYSDTTSALVINKLTKSQYETLKASGSLQSNQIYITPETLPSNLGDFNNDVGYVTASAVAASYATKSEVETVSASVSTLTSSFGTLSSSVDAMGSQVSALAASMSGKRDYLDLTYSYSTPAEQFNLASLQSNNPSYCQKVSFTLNGGVHDALSIPWDSNHWWNYDAQIEVFWGEEESLE